MFNLVDLFAGAGGITAGFSYCLGKEYSRFDPPFLPILAVDYDIAAMQTYEANFGPHSVVASLGKTKVLSLSDGSFRLIDVDALTKKRVIARLPSDIHVIVGGPPCQGFSRLGRMNGFDRKDPRNTLWIHFMEFVDKIRPSIFLIENVPPLLNSRQGQEILNEAHELGYYLAQPKILDSALFGIPQKRKRAFVLGSRIGPIELPEPSYEEMTVRDAFKNLPDPETDPLYLLRNPTAVSIERYKTIPPGGNRFDLMEKRPDITPPCWMKKTAGSTDVMGRLWWSKPAVTIRTEFFKPEKGRYLHPEEHRAITHREAAALQTFPNEYEFKGSRTEIARQIGNAVPPLLAYHIAKVIHERLLKPLPGHDVNSVPNLVKLKKADLLNQRRS